MKNPVFAHSSLLVNILLRLLIGVLLFAILQITFVLFNYLHHTDDLAQGLLNWQAKNITKFIPSTGYDPAIEDRATDIQAQTKWSQNARMAFAVYTESGQKILSAGDADLYVLLPSFQASISTKTVREDYQQGFRLYGTRKMHHGQPLWVSMVIEGKGLAPYFSALLTEIMEHVALPIIPLALFLLVFSFIVVRNTLQPVTRTIEQINNIRPDDISFRLQMPDAPQEVRKLVQAMNKALGRIESAVHSLKNFTADTAHELRTPLAIMLLEVDKLPKSQGKDQLKKDLAGMSRLVQQMLDMAYANALVLQPEDRMILSDVAKETIHKLAPLTLKSGRSIRMTDHSLQQPVPGHSEAFSRALRNIIENALIHTPAGTTIDVVIDSNDRIKVMDQGQGIPLEQQKKVLNRFCTNTHASAKSALSLAMGQSSTGLGLAIASRIAQAHGGKLYFTSTAEQRHAVVIAIHPDIKQNEQTSIAR